MADMQANSKISSVSKDCNNQAGFSSYLNTNKPTAAKVWDYSLEAPCAGNSWDRGGGLPPPPVACRDDLVIQPKSIPSGPAKSWNLDVSDEEMSDEGTDKPRIDQLQDSGSDSEEHDSESECTTEIFVPKVNPTQPRRSVGASKQQQYSALMRHQPETGCDVIPSVSNDNLWLTSPNKLHREALTEEIATNIDSGISNETSHGQSQDGATVKQRTLSVSSSSHYSSSYSCGSRGDIPSPKIGQQSRIDNIAIYMREAKVSRVVNFLSASYAIILVILGVVFSLLKVDSSMAIEGFFMYLNGLGILFLIYVYTTIIRAMRRAPSPQIVHRMGSTLPHQCSTYESDVVPTVGNLFLRVATVLFCAGSLVDIGLMLGLTISHSCNLDPKSTVQPLLQAAFVILQIYFVFNNTNMRVRRYPIVAKFGIMHLIAADITMWISRVISEIKEDISSRAATMEQTDVTSDVNGTYIYTEGDGTELNLIRNVEDAASNCTQNQWVIGIADQVKPYVYPCTIQFCVLSCCILFVVWRKVDKNCDTQCSDCRENSQRSSESDTRTIDCGSTSRGLFLGILVLVTAIASLIAFFMLTTNNYYDIRATLVMHIYYIAVYLVMTVISVVVLLKLRVLDYNTCRTTLLEDILVVLCLISLSTYDILSIISAVLHLYSMKGLLVLASSSVELIQSVVQMATIIMGLKLCTPDVSEQPISRPGRECVTFLAVTNIALWLLSIFSNTIAQNYEVQETVLGQASWSYVIYMFGPIVMLYHLFSASCFIDIWYNAYRMAAPSIAHV